MNFDKLDQEYLANNIEIRPIRIAGDIVIAIIIDDQNIMLAIAASSGLSMRNGQHRFHRYNHPRLKNRIDIPTPIKSPYAAIIR